MNESNFPEKVHTQTYLSIMHSLQVYSENWNNGILPILVHFGLSDDDHVRKYLNCQDFKPVYEDLKKNERAMRFFKFLCKVTDNDVFKGFRDRDCDVLYPWEDGFVFGEISQIRDDLKSCLYVKDGKVCIDTELAKKKSSWTPLPTRVKVYDVVHKYVQELAKLGYTGYECLDFVEFNYHSKKIQPATDRICHEVKK